MSSVKRIECSESQHRFLDLQTRFRAFVGGYGCIRGSTKILLKNGPCRIDCVMPGDEAVSWDAKNQRYLLSPTSGGYQKGMAKLYRVVTRQGEFVAAAHHRVLSPSGKYRYVSGLSVGEEVSQTCLSPNLTNLEFDRIWSPEGDLYYWQTAVDCLDGYEYGDHQYGQQLRLALKIAQSFVPLQGDVQESLGCFYPAKGMRSGDLLGRKQKHTRQGQSACHQQMNHFFSRMGRIVVGGASQIQAGLFERILPLTQQLKRFLSNFSYRLPKTLFFRPDGCSHPIFAGEHQNLWGVSAGSFCGSTLGCGSCFSRQAPQFPGRFGHHRKARLSFSSTPGSAKAFLKSFQKVNSSISNARIIHIERLKVKESFWDIHVAGTNNYITEDGAIHHNSGKTFIGSIALCKNHWEIPGIKQGYFAPTYPSIRDVFFPTIDEAAFKMGLSCEIREGAKEVHMYSSGGYRGTIICRSMDNPNSIVGFEIGRALVDELDILSATKANNAWKKIIARIRLKREGLVNGVDVTTTPEGFKTTHQLFVKNVAENEKLKGLYGIVNASTYENEENLPEGYIQSLVDTYPKELIDAYVNGQFVNMTSGTVYYKYNRHSCASTENMKEKEPLYIGMDFNVGNMAASVFVQRENGWHAVAELKKVFDTPAMIQVIQEKWSGRTITIYPDATGSSRESVDASKSDIALLQRAGFKIRAKSKNPTVRDSVLSINKRFEIGQLWVNSKQCPTIASCLEQQSYDANGEPDKSSGFDHQNDSFRYPISYEFPIVKPTTTTIGISVL